MEFKSVAVSELEGSALDWAVMTVEGFRLVRVGYLGLGPKDDVNFNESPEQVDLPEWFESSIDCTVGAYWMREVDQAVFEAYWPGYMHDFQSTASPSTDWSQGGPLIDKYLLLVCPPEETDQWEASVNGDYEMHYGRTALIAACRAIVAARLGSEVSAPASLLKEPS